VQIRLNSTLRGRIGRREFDLDYPDGTTVRQALDMTAGEAPELVSILLDTDGNLQPNIVIFRNGRNIEFFDGLDTSLQMSDTVDIFPKTGAQRAFATD
jgi:MoaD family protein